MLPDVGLAHGVQNKLSHGSSQAGNLLASHLLLLLSKLVKGTPACVACGGVCASRCAHPPHRLLLFLLLCHYCLLTTARLFVDGLYFRTRLVFCDMFL